MFYRVTVHQFCCLQQTEFQLLHNLFHTRLGGKDFGKQRSCLFWYLSAVNQVLVFLPNCGRLNIILFNWVHFLSFCAVHICLITLKGRKKSCLILKCFHCVIAAIFSQTSVGEEFVKHVCSFWESSTLKFGHIFHQLWSVHCFIVF